MAVLTLRATREPVAGIDLHTRLCGVNLHHAANTFVGELGGKRNFVFCHAVDDPAAVVTFAVDKIRESFLDVTTDEFALGEVHWRFGHGCHLASGNQLVGGGQETRGVQSQFMVEDVAVAFTFQVEIGVVSEVDDVSARLIGAETDVQFVLVVEGIIDLRHQFSRIACLAIGTEVGEHHTLAIDAAGPFLVGKADAAAM